VAELAGKATMEQTICIMVMSLSLVMAGTGDLDVIRLVRFLRSRVGPARHSTVTYGSHMALHMSLGLLFLGGGRYTLNTRPESVAAMVAAFFPKFPTHSNDNRYHLQALRHLYVLAAEPRLLIPRFVIFLLLFLLLVFF
jgi:anaphase-promoting complex subunit 1